MIHLDPALPLLAAVIEVARTDAGVVLAFAGNNVAVWESEPSRAAGFEGATGYPFIEVPSIQVLGDERVDNGVCVFDPSEAFAQVSVFSRQKPNGSGGKPEAMLIAEALRSALGREIPLEAGTGFRVTLGHFVTARHFTESDALTAHSSLTFRYELEPSED